jgi:hypothetical protein
MLGNMSLLFDSFWRAVAYGLRPRVVVLSFLPLLLMGGLALGLGYFYWAGVLETVNLWLESSTLVGSISGWLQGMGLGNLKAVLAPLIVIFAVTPLIVVFSLLTVALMMTPALTSLVAERRFPALERKRGGSLVASLWWSLVSTLLALLALIVSVPLWLIPPLILILPPLIWGWLTYRVMAFDALAEHASSEERRELFRRHRMSLLGIGIFCGYLGAAPSLIWASGVLFVAAFVVLVPLAIWLYTLVFAFASLWFAHFCLAALQTLRAERAAAATAPTPPDAEILDSLPLSLSHAPDLTDSPKPARE